MHCETLALTSHHLTFQQPNMIRKQARQRRDYLYRKALILKEAETTEKRAQLRSALASGKPIDPEIAKNKALRKDYQYDESRPDRTVDEEMDLDDEYSQLSGISEPRLLVSVSLFHYFILGTSVKAHPFRLQEIRLRGFQPSRKRSDCYCLHPLGSIVEI